DPAFAIDATTDQLRVPPPGSASRSRTRGRRIVGCLRSDQSHTFDPDTASHRPATLGPLPLPPPGPNLATRAVTTPYGPGHSSQEGPLSGWRSRFCPGMTHRCSPPGRIDWRARDGREKLSRFEVLLRFLVPAKPRSGIPKQSTTPVETLR